LGNFHTIKESAIEGEEEKEKNGNDITSNS
jgi:hypothetical protein